jgi:hypothetical protein
MVLWYVSRFEYMLSMIQQIHHQVSVGGHIPVIDAAKDGRMGIRIFEPCDDPTGSTCHLFEDPATLHLAETRWYTTSIRIFDGSLVRGHLIFTAYAKSYLSDR